MAERANVIKVLIVDDHPVVRLGLRTMLESEENISVTGMAGSAKRPWRKYNGSSRMSC